MRQIFLTLLFSSLLSVSFASNLNFLESAPIASFNSDDTAMMEKTILRALDSLKDGDKLAWKNDKSGNSGLVNPVKSYKQNGSECRTLRIINRSKKAIRESQHDFCRSLDSKWKIYKK